MKKDLTKFYFRIHFCTFLYLNAITTCNVCALLKSPRKACSFKVFACLALMLTRLVSSLDIFF
jgi:hypothetical protein